MTRLLKHIRLAFLLAAVPSLFALVLPAAAQSGIISNVGSTQTNFNVGDVVGVIVQLEHPAGYRVIVPELEAEWGDFELRDVTLLDIVSAENNRELSTLQINVTAWEPGDYPTPQFNLKIAAPDGSLSIQEIGSIGLTVDSILTAEDIELRDIKAQADLPFPSRAPLYATIGALVVVAFAGLLLLIWRNRRLTPDFEETSVVKDLRPANVIALETLGEIEAQDLATQGRYKDHYTLVSDAIRQYLERAFKISAMEATTYEIRNALRKDSGLDVVQRTRLEQILQEADFVKFARVKPSLEEAKMLPQSARDFVQTSYALSAEKNHSEEPEHVDEEVEPEEEIIA